MEIPDSEQSVTLPRKIKPKKFAKAPRAEGEYVQYIDPADGTVHLALPATPSPPTAPYYNTLSTGSNITFTMAANTAPISLSVQNLNTAIKKAEGAMGKLADNLERTDEVLDVEYVTYIMTDKTHPDGSVFFEWDRPRKR